MTNLPITNSSPQTAPVTKQTANTGDAADAQSSQPFGEVLARQINGPATKDVKADDKLAIDSLAQLGTDSISVKKDAIDVKKDTADTRKSDAVATDAATMLPTDMLAAMLPQAMNTTSATPPGTKSDNSAISTSTTEDKRSIAMLKTNAANIPADTPKLAANANPGAQPKEQSFANVLAGSATRPATGMEIGASVHDTTATSAASQQSNAAAIAALQNNAASIAAPVLQPVQVTINTPVNQDKWSDEFSQSITWLASSKLDQTAELHLNPPQLGPLDVVIKVSGDQATALFTSPHAAVREAVEQALPRLRDMLADNGIMLGNATVSDQAPRDQGQSSAPRAPVPISNDIRDTTVSGSTVRVSPISQHNGIVDTFA